jgi:hypothetical protein
LQKKYPFAEIYRKLLMIARGLLLADIVVGQSSHGHRTYMASKLRPCVAFGSEMKYIKTFVADRVNV